MADIIWPWLGMIPHSPSFQWRHIHPPNHGVEQKPADFESLVPISLGLSLTHSGWCQWQSSWLSLPAFNRWSISRTSEESRSKTFRATWWPGCGAWQAGIHENRIHKKWVHYQKQIHKWVNKGYGCILCICLYIIFFDLSIYIYTYTHYVYVCTYTTIILYDHVYHVIYIYIYNQSNMKTVTQPSDWDRSNHQWDWTFHTSHKNPSG